MRAAFDAGRTQDEEHLKLQLLLCIEAGANARVLCTREGWHWARLSSRLALVHDLFWQIRNDLSPIDDDLIGDYASCCFVEVQKRQYELSSDSYVHLLNKYYASNGDLATEKARRRTTQKVMTENATLRGAKEFIVQRYLSETGLVINPLISTLYRRMTAKRADTDEGRRHRHIAVDARRWHSGRGDVGDKADVHYSLALGRYVREWAHNKTQRSVSAGGGVVIPPAPTQSGVLLLSMDDKAKIHLHDTPVRRRYRPEWHLLARDADGDVTRPKPILKTLSVDQNKQDSVIHHAMLILNEGPARPDTGVPCGVLSHGSYDRSPALHIAELLLHVETFTSVWRLGDATHERAEIYSDRGPHENLARMQVILSYRYVMYLLGLKLMVLAAPAVSSYNPVEHVHTSTNSALGESPIGVSGSKDGDVRAVAKRIASARYNGKTILNALMLDGTMESVVPSTVATFIRGNIKSAKGDAKAASSALLDDTVPVTPRIMELRRQLRLGRLTPMTFRQLKIVSPQRRC